MIAQDSWFGLSCNENDAHFIDEVRGIMRAQKSCMYTLSDIFASAILPGSSINSFVMSYRLRDYQKSSMSKFHYALIRGGLNLDDVQTSKTYIHSVLPPNIAQQLLRLISAPCEGPFSETFGNIHPTVLQLLPQVLKILETVRLPRVIEDTVRVQQFCQNYYGSSPLLDVSYATLKVIENFIVIALAPAIRLNFNIENLLSGGKEWDNVDETQCQHQKRRQHRDAKKVTQNCVIGDARAEAIQYAVFTFALYRKDLTLLLYDPIREYLLKNAVLTCEKGERTTADGVNEEYVEHEIDNAIWDFMDNKHIDHADSRTLSVLMHSPDATDNFDYFKCDMKAFVVSENAMAHDGKLDVILHILCGPDAIKLLICPLVAYWKQWGVRYAFLISVGGHVNPLRQKMYSRLGFQALFAEEKYSQEEIAEIIQLVDTEEVNAAVKAAEASETGRLANFMRSFFAPAEEPPQPPQPLLLSLDTRLTPELTLAYAKQSRGMLKVLREVNSHHQVPGFLPMVANFTTPYPSVDCLMTYMTQRDINCDGRVEGNALHPSQRRGSMVDQLYKQQIVKSLDNAKRVFEDEAVVGQFNTVENRSPIRRRRYI